ncbi:polysialyltransferase family glycosyltransferase [Candidatus Sororendozoicomonas aggregata]|uniref:polysialyltransferase family glycosyltransferase n=1 Tax=Candidatus Sororendozoicomonas aggregata TaxID=3073239 RepID=UPI002ED2E598
MSIKTDQPDALNVYLVNSGFQTVASVTLANKRKNNIFICFEQFLLNSVQSINSDWAARTIKFEKKKGLLGRRRGVVSYLMRIFALLSTFPQKKVNFYMITIVGSEYNYIIDRAVSQYGAENVTFNIIPDGSSNIAIEYFSSERKKARVQKRRVSWLDRAYNLRYTPYSGDKRGILSDIVNKIYTIPGLSHEYPPAKCEALPVPRDTLKVGNGKKKALILGQTLCNDQLMSSLEELEVKKKIINFLSCENVESIYYLPHTVAKIYKIPYELMIDGAQLVNSDKPFELYMLDEQFDYIISVYSTALITAKLFFGHRTRVVSIGSGLVSASTTDFFTNFSLYNEIGIEVIQ